MNTKYLVLVSVTGFFCAHETMGMEKLGKTFKEALLLGTTQSQEKTTRTAKKKQKAINPEIENLKKELDTILHDATISDYQRAYDLIPVYKELEDKTKDNYPEYQEFHDELIKVENIKLRYDIQAQIGQLEKERDKNKVNLCITYKSLKNTYTQNSAGQTNAQKEIDALEQEIAKEKQEAEEREAAQAKVRQLRLDKICKIAGFTAEIQRLKLQTPEKPADKFKCTDALASNLEKRYAVSRGLQDYEQQCDDDKNQARMKRLESIAYAPNEHIKQSILSSLR